MASPNDRAGYAQPAQALRSQGSIGKGQGEGGLSAAAPPGGSDGGQPGQGQRVASGSQAHIEYASSHELSTHGRSSSGGVKDIASRFTGSSAAQPEALFQQAYATEQSKARRASLDAKSTHAQYRGRGDDVLTEHERSQRLEALARRRAELEAAEFLHRYSGTHANAFALLLSLSRARLGLPLTVDEEQALHAAAAAGGSTEGSTWFAEALRGITAQSIDAERRRALGGAGEYSSQEERAGQTLRWTNSGTQAIWATGSQQQQQPDSDDGEDGEEAVPVTGAEMDGLRGYSARAGGAAGHVAGVESLMDTPVAIQQQQSPEEALKAQEVSRLLTLLTGLVQAQGSPMTLGDLSAGLAEKTGRSWGAYWEGRHGPLLLFLKQHGQPGVHILTRNKWLSLPGMPAPSTPKAAPPAPAPVPQPVQQPASPPAPISYSLPTHATAQGANIGGGMPQYQGYQQMGMYGPQYAAGRPLVGATGQGLGGQEWNPFDERGHGQAQSDALVPVAQIAPYQQQGGAHATAAGWDWDMFESRHTSSTTQVTTTTEEAGGPPPWHTAASPFTQSTTAQQTVLPGGHTHGQLSGPSVLDRMNLSTFEREASIREEARRKQEAEDEALARRILAQEHEEEAARQAGSRGTGSRRASAAATMAGNGSSPYTSGGPSTSSSHRHMSTYTESNNLLGSQPGRAGATEQRVMQTVQSAPREGMRAAQEAYHQYRGYGQMVPDTAGGSYGAGGAELAHYRQGSGVSHTTHTSSTSAVRRYSAPAGSTALARAGAAGGSSGMYGDHRAFVEEEGRVRGDTFAQLDEEQFAQSTLARGVSEDAGLSWADFDLLFRPLLIHGFTLIKHGRMGPPKARRFWMNRALTKLYWDTSRIVDALRTGERHLEVEDVMSLAEGCETDLLRMKAARGEVNAASGRFFSLITTTRTFDLEAASGAQRKVLCRAFRFLIRNMQHGSAAARAGPSGSYSARPALTNGPASARYSGISSNHQYGR